MPQTERAAPRFYFALPRLYERLRQRPSGRTELNFVEANIVGTAVMLISYLGIAHWVLRDAARWQQVAFLLPVVVLTWLFWLILLYLNAQIIKLLRAAGAFAHLSNARLQSVLAGVAVTVFAYKLCDAGPLLGAIGLAWLVAVCLNLGAAVSLALLQSHDEG
jgi:hypothetical protein